MILTNKLLCQFSNHSLKIYNRPLPVEGVIYNNLWLWHQFILSLRLFVFILIDSFFNVNMAMKETFVFVRNPYIMFKNYGCFWCYRPLSKWNVATECLNHQIVQIDFMRLFSRVGRGNHKTGQHLKLFSGNLRISSSQIQHSIKNWQTSRL